MRVGKKESPNAAAAAHGLLGHFQEGQDDQIYTIDTIVRQKLLTGRKRRLKAAPGHSLKTLSPRVPEHFHDHPVLHPHFLGMALLPRLGQNPDEFMAVGQIYSTEVTRFPLRIRITSLVPAKLFPRKCGQLLTSLGPGKCASSWPRSSPEAGGRRFLIPATYLCLAPCGGRYFRPVSDIATAVQRAQVQFRVRENHPSPTEQFASFTASECFLELQNSVVAAHIHGLESHFSRCPYSKQCLACRTHSMKICGQMDKCTRWFASICISILSSYSFLHQPERHLFRAHYAQAYDEQLTSLASSGGSRKDDLRSSPLQHIQYCTVLSIPAQFQTECGASTMLKRKYRAVMEVSKHAEQERQEDGFEENNHQIEEGN
ncbi:Protein THEMIS3 [Fukomys damarensis]|uniref:Protein THEMIS3 n=1 Tax=Fukomys damarensis TaxID=885580 RepID=A0A091D9Y1_FUKDA|nr:Protein THEMIS3 [Fukomys damarensis]